MNAIGASAANVQTLIDTVATTSDRTRLNSAAAHLSRNQLPSGLFPYDYDFSSGESTPMEGISGVNLVRQSGAVFSLSKYFEISKDSTAGETIRLFLEAASNQSIPIAKGRRQQSWEKKGYYNHRYLWGFMRLPLYWSGMLFQETGEARLVSVDEDYKRAFPGATALSLVSALTYREVTGNQQFDSMLAQWIAGLSTLLVDDRGSRQAPHYLSESDYVNAQTWLALADYHRSFPENTAVLATMLRLEKYLFARYSESPSIKFYSWGLMATSVRQQTTGDTRYVEFARTLTDWLLSQPREQTIPDTTQCARIEGLATFVNMMAPLDGESNQLVKSAGEVIAKDLAQIRPLQITASLARLPNVHKNADKVLDKFRGGFIYSAEEPLMIVDLTGHCLHALLLTLPE